MQGPMDTTLSMPLIGLAPARSAHARAARPAAAAGLTAVLATAGIACILSLSGQTDTGPLTAFARWMSVGQNDAATASIPVSTYDPIDGRSRVVAWRASMEAFAESDRAHAPTPGGVVFVGSSSIRAWDSLEKDFPASHVVKRGFGGSRLADSAYYADRLVLPYKPRQVVVYAGENDLANGATPEAVLASFVSLAQQVHAAQPETRIAFVSIKPSPSRQAQHGAALRSNELIAAYTRSAPGLDYIDVYTPMLDSAGQPRADLFQADMLHLSPAGYAVWKNAITPYLR